jgi:hypothetical protein
MPGARCTRGPLCKVESTGVDFRSASWAVFTVRNGLDHPI